jgi:hypothetical protein
MESFLAGPGLILSIWLCFGIVSITALIFGLGSVMPCFCNQPDEREIFSASDAGNKIRPWATSLEQFSFEIVYIASESDAHGWFESCGYAQF